MWLDTDRSGFITAIISCNLHQNWKTQHMRLLFKYSYRTYRINQHACYNEVSCYTLYKQWQCIIQLLLPLTVLMYKLRKLRSHFIRGYAWRSSVAILSARSCVRSCGTRAELIVWVARSCMTLVRGYLSLRSCGQVLGTPRDTVVWMELYSFARNIVQRGQHYMKHVQNYKKHLQHCKKHMQRFTKHVQHYTKHVQHYTKHLIIIIIIINWHFKRTIN